jgi:hypothetical protein
MKDAAERGDGKPRNEKPSEDEAADTVAEAAWEGPEVADLPAGDSAEGGELRKELEYVNDRQFELLLVYYL